VGRIRSLRKFLFALLLGLCAVLSLTLLVSQIEQRLFRRRAELLLSQVQALELRKNALARRSSPTPVMGRKSLAWKSL
jgi:hypothetical protein